MLLAVRDALTTSGKQLLTWADTYHSRGSSLPPYAPEGVQGREWENEFSPQTHVSPLGLSIAAPSLKNFSIPEASWYFKLAIDTLWSANNLG